MPVLHSVLIDSRFKKEKALLSRVLLRPLWKFREGLLTPLVKSDHIFAGPSSGHRNNSWGYNKHDDTPLCSADGHKAHFVILIKVRGNDIQTPMQTSWNWPWVDTAAGKQFTEQIELFSLHTVPMDLHIWEQYCLIPLQWCDTCES